MKKIKVDPVNLTPEQQKELTLWIAGILNGVCEQAGLNNRNVVNETSLKYAQTIANNYWDKWDHDKTAIEAGEKAIGGISFSQEFISKGYMPVDELMGFLPRLRYSPLVQAKLSELATSSEFRKVSKAVSCLTPLQISPSGIHGIVQRVSKKVENHEDNVKELVHKEKKTVSVLYLEGDALAVKSQDKGIININRFQVHEGVRKVGKRGHCINLHQFSGRSRKKFFRIIT